MLPQFLWGVTWDDVSNAAKIKTFLASMPKPMISRVVFDEFVPAKNYVAPLTTLAGYPIMGELLDSYYVNKYSVANYLSRAKEYLAVLGGKVDLWEVGNEVNGEWLGTVSSVISKVKGAHQIFKAAGKKTAVTFYYNSGCYEKADHEMFTFIAKYWPKEIQPDYVFVSYYEDDCENLQPNWQNVFTKLGTIFPNSKIGIGECGTEIASKKKSYLTRYYSMKINHPNYVGGYFWWYGRQDFLGKYPALVDTLKGLMK